YLNGERSPGERKKSAADPFEPFLAYVTARLVEDPHLWSRTLCDELEDLGYTPVLSDIDPPDPATWPASDM
ncbi:putative transposase, partial [Gordonia otitidis NBRC 100426]